MNIRIKPITKYTFNEIKEVYKDVMQATSKCPCHNPNSRIFYSFERYREAFTIRDKELKEEFLYEFFESIVDNSILYGKGYNEFLSPNTVNIIKKYKIERAYRNE